MAAAVLCVTIVGQPDPVAGQACVVAGVGQLLPSEDGLRVVATEAPALQADDLLLQLNAKRLRTCADLRAALTTAQRDNLVPVLALRRAGTMQTIALVPAPTAPVAPAASTPTPMARETATAVPLTGTDVEPLREMTMALQKFDARTTPPLVAPEPFRKRLGDLRATYARLSPSAAGVAAAGPVLEYYDTVAEILVYKEEVGTGRSDRQDATRENLSRGRRAPGAAYEYHSDGPVTGWLERYPFLQPAIVRPPRRLVGQVEESGRWQPDEAISLLLAKARADVQSIGARLPAAQ